MDARREWYGSTRSSPACSSSEWYWHSRWRSASFEAERVSFNAKIDGEAVALIIVAKVAKFEVNDKIDAEAQVY